MGCRICGNASGNRPFEAREMMFGTRETFSYQECGACGGLWLVNVPSDLARHYGPGYYSTRMSFRWLRGVPGVYRLAHRLRLRPAPHLPEWWPVANRNARILDIGSGVGHLLWQLKSLGFRHLRGVDPFIPRDLRWPLGPTILKKQLSEIDGRFDVLVLNHSFEHMPSPGTVLSDLKRLLAPGGSVVIRTPVASSLAWRKYHADWVQLDAPRHLFVPTVRSIELLAESSGLAVRSVVHDSTGFQFWGSEQYRRGIPLHSRRSYQSSPAESLFTEDQISEFDRFARELNRQGRGDQASFHLQ